MTVYRKIVFSFDEGTFIFHTACYDSLTLVIPDVVDLFEFVGVYPYLDLFFVLRRFFWDNGCSCEYFVWEYRDIFVVFRSLIVVGSS